MRTIGDLVVFDVEGEVDLYRSPEVRKDLLSLVSETPGKLAVNLSKVSYIDSSGLATLIEAYQKINRAGGEFALIGINEAIKSIFEISRLDRVFKTFPTEKEAVEAWSGSK